MQYDNKNDNNTLDLFPERLSREELIALCIRMENGDKAARETLILSHIPFVRFLAEKYANNSTALSFEDLCQEGYFGLIEAVDRYDYRHGVLLSSYASVYIIKHFHEAIRRECVIQLPDHLHGHLRELNKVYAEYHNNNTSFPTDEEMSKLIGLPQEYIQLLKNYSYIYKKTYARELPEEKRLTTLPNASFSRPVEDATMSNLGVLDFSALGVQLTTREEEVLKRKLGLPPYTEKQSFNKISSIMNLSREPIRLAYKSAISKLREVAKRKGYNINTFPLR